MIRDSFYYSKRLCGKLEKISEFPVTVVAAPAGYGKTSVLYKKTEEIGMKRVWVDAMDTTPQKSYGKLCKAFLATGASCGPELDRLGFPNSTNSFEIASSIQKAKCNGGEYLLIIDNFQFLQSALPVNILSALTNRQGNNLHIVMVTNHLWDSFIYELNNALLISTNDFSIPPDEIIQYFLSEGVEISRAEAERIYSVTNGWGVAVFLHLNQFFNFGSSINENNTVVLIEELIWNHYNKDMKECMLRLAPFNRFDDETICYMLKYETLPAYIPETLKSTPLIFFDHINRLYCPHKIVTDFFRFALDCRASDLKEDIYNRAGDYLLLTDNLKEALQCYLNGENYDKILSLNHVSIYHTLAGDDFYVNLANRVLEKAPCESKKKYPFTILCFARLYFDIGDFERSSLLIQEIYLEAERLDDPRLLGEAVLMSALDDFPDIFKMRKKYEHGAKLLNGVSSIFLPQGLYMSGCPSMLSLFYREPGSADAVDSELEKAISIYGSITGGHGRGADLLFKGELALMRCELDEALIFAYKAEDIGEESRQYTIMMGSALLKGNIAIALKDEKMLEEAISYINEISPKIDPKQDSQVIHNMINTGLDLLFCASGCPEGSPNENYCGSTCLHPANEISLYATMCRLLHNRQFAKLIGIVENACKKTDMSSVVFSLYSKIFLALSYGSIDKGKMSERLITDAFNIAREDHLFLPFSLRMDALSSLISKDLYRDISLFINPEDPESKTYQNQAVGELTPREREIARLAAQGMRNREIANKLYISEGTVRNHLSIAFQKLGIDRRSKLWIYADIL